MYLNYYFILLFITIQISIETEINNNTKSDISNKNQLLNSKSFHVKNSTFIQRKEIKLIPNRLLTITETGMPLELPLEINPIPNHNPNQIPLTSQQKYIETEAINLLLIQENIDNFSNKNKPSFSYLEGESDWPDTFCHNGLKQSPIDLPDELEKFNKSSVIKILVHLL